MNRALIAGLIALPWLMTACASGPRSTRSATDEGGQALAGSRAQHCEQLARRVTPRAAGPESGGDWTGAGAWINAESRASYEEHLRSSMYRRCLEDADHPA